MSARITASGSKRACTAGNIWAIERVTVLIDKAGIVKRVWRKVKVPAMLPRSEEAAGL